MAYQADLEAGRTRRSPVARFAAKLATVLGIAFATGVAWLLRELLTESSVERILDAWASWLANQVDAWLTMDATTAAVVIPVAGFLIIVVGVYFFARRS